MQLVWRVRRRVCFAVSESEKENEMRSGESMEDKMRQIRSRGILAAGMALAMGITMIAAGGAGAQDTSGPVANPVSTVVKNNIARFQKNMVGGAEAMPAEKYSFKPTPEMSSYGHLIVHITQTNYTLCSKLSGATAPDVKLADTDPKEKL